MLCGWDSFLIQMQHCKARVMHFRRGVLHFASRVLHFFGKLDLSRKVQSGNTQSLELDEI